MSLVLLHMEFNTIHKAFCKHLNLAKLYSKSRKEREKAQ